MAAKIQLPQQLSLLTASFTNMTAFNQGDHCIVPMEGNGVEVIKEQNQVISTEKVDCSNVSDNLKGFSEELNNVVTVWFPE